MAGNHQRVAIRHAKQTAFTALRCLDGLLSNIIFVYSFPFLPLLVVQV